MMPEERKPDPSKRPGFPWWGYLLIVWGVVVGVVIIIALAVVVPMLLQGVAKQLPLPW